MLSLIVNGTCFKVVSYLSDDDHEDEDMYFDLAANQSGMSSMESSFASSVKSSSTTSTTSKSIVTYF